MTVNRRAIINEIIEAGLNPGKAYTIDAKTGKLGSQESEATEKKKNRPKPVEETVVAPTSDDVGPTGASGTSDQSPIIATGPAPVPLPVPQPEPFPLPVPVPPPAPLPLPVPVAETPPPPAAPIDQTVAPADAVASVATPTVKRHHRLASTPDKK